MTKPRTMRRRSVAPRSPRCARTFVNIHEAKTHLSRLLADVGAGKEVVIARDGEPIAELIPYRRNRLALAYGKDKGKIWMAPDFDAPDVWSDEEREAFGM